jgi:hypothetical protein
MDNNLNIRLNDNTSIDLLRLKEIIHNNYTSCQSCFAKVQSDFLVGMYNRYYKDLDTSNIVLSFGVNFHRSVLHQRVFDFDHDISYKNFWKNLEKIRQKKTKIIDIAKDTGLPRETTRRKVNSLIKLKVLHKTKSNIYWKPNNKQVSSFEQIVENQIDGLSKIINEISFFLHLKIDDHAIKEEIKKNFSFYWYHYLSTFLEYNKYWQKKNGDIDSLFIILQYIISILNFLKKNNIKERKDVFSKKILSNFDLINTSIGSTSLERTTGLPKATCIRKLQNLVKIKVLEKDLVTKKFFLNLKNMSDLNISFLKDIDEMSINIFSNFYLILIKALLRSKKIR